MIDDAKRDRIAKFAQHFNCTPVEMDRYGTLQPMDLSDVKEREAKSAAAKSVATIKQSLSNGAAQVTLACPDSRVEQEIREQLSEQELSRVIFHTAR